MTEARIDQSVERIMKAKMECGGSAAAFKAAAELPHSIAERAITLVRDTSRLLPTRKGTIVVVTDIVEGNPLAELGDVPVINSETRDFEIDADILILALALRAKSGLGRIAIPEAAKRLAEKHAKRTIAISFGSPYLLRELGDVSTYLCAYGIQPIMQRAAMRAIRGEAPMTGRLPVTI